FFTFFFPIMFLVLFNLLFGDNMVEVEGGVTKESHFFVPGIMAFAVVSACYTNIAMNVTFARDQGLLKRLRGTPLPPVAYILGRMGQAVLAALILVLIVIGFGPLFYGLEPRATSLPAFIF